MAGCQSRDIEIEVVTLISNRRIRDQDELSASVATKTLRATKTETSPAFREGRSL